MVGAEQLLLWGRMTESTEPPVGRAPEKCDAHSVFYDQRIPSCAYNNVGYREQARIQLEGRTRARAKARHRGSPYDPPPLTFSFDNPLPDRTP